MEIVPVSNPLGVTQNGRVIFEVRYRGKGFANQNVSIIRRLEGPASAQELMTDEKGQVSFTAGVPDAYLMRVKFDERNQRSEGEYDLTSYEATYVFQVFYPASLVCELSVAIAAGNASAHAYPDEVSPGDGATVAQAPGEVRIKFTEGVELEFSRIDVKNATGQRVSKGSVRRAGSDTLTIDLLPLEPGGYTVEWQVLSVDTHITQGVLRFTVKPK